ncbi:MAG: right-handed parallel beta-helix repeat-containing protein [Candidatus Marinimicrobia bacterium]|nr:right-handed parallel beta-helix repeat-containing protein [Candidatus Neomarinimicrobiota bacterium]
MGQTIEQGIGYGSGSFISPEIKNNISTNFPNEGFTIGAVSDDEGVDGSEANLDIELVVTYEYEGDQIISLTAKNDLDGEDGAHIGVGFYPNVSPQSKQSPYEFDAYVTQRIRLEAYDNNPDASGKLWFFNDTEHTQEKSEWRDESGGSEFLSSSASYTTAPLATADDGAVYTAYLRTTDYTTSGTMTGNETWWTPVTVTNNLTIGSGVTLTVKEGTTVQVSNDKKISVYGTLNADDATFTASTNEWDGIVFESTGTGDIEYSTLSYASTAVQCNSTSAILFGNTFHHNGYHFKGIGRGSLTTIWENDLSNADYYAIYLDNHSAWIDGNTIDLTNGAVYGLAIYNNYYNPGAIIIENNSFAGGTWTSGIRVISGTATIQDNDIYNTGTGLLSDRMSNPKLRLSSNDGKNVITDNSTGISVMENALIDMGSGYNTIADNSSRNLRNYNESNEINAVYNYWGADPPAGEQILWRHRLQSLARRR